MNKTLQYIFFIVLGGSLLFMGYYMNKLSKLGNRTSMTQEVAK